MVVRKTEKNSNVFFRSFLNNGLNTIFTFVFGIISSVLFTRIFGIELFGSFTLIASYVTIFFSISTLGILSGFKREAIWFVSNKKNIGGYILLVYIFSLICSIILVLPFLIFNNFFFEFLDISNDLLNPLIFYFIAHIIFYVPATIFLYVFESYQDIFPITYINFLGNIFKVLAILVLGYIIVNIYSGILAYFLISNLIILLFSLFTLLKSYKLKFDFITIKFSVQRLLNAIKFSIKLFPLMISELILGNLAILLLGKYGNLEDVGFFRILFTFYLLLNFIPTFFGKVLTPMITKFFFKNQLKKILKYYNICFKISMCFSIPIIIIIGFFTKEILFIYGIESQYLLNCMWILLLTNIFLIGSSLGSVFSAYNRPELISLFLVLGSVLNLILSYSLIPEYGILGACISILISNIIIQASMHLYAIFIMKFSIKFKPVLQTLFNGFLFFGFFYLTNSINSSLFIKIGYLFLGLFLFLVISTYNNIFNRSEFESFKNIINQINNNKLKFFSKKILKLFFHTQKV